MTASLKIALVVPGGVDRSAEHRVIPALLALLKRLASRHEVHVYAFAQQETPGTWDLLGARIHNIGVRSTHAKALKAILRENRAAPFHVVHSMWSGGCGFVAVLAAEILRIPSIVHVAGGELAALPEICYGGRLTWKGRLRELLVLRRASIVSAASQPIIGQIAAVGVQALRIPLGVALDTWPVRQPIRRNGGEKVRLVHVASLNRVKDQATLLRALAILAASDLDFHADIVGEDTLRGEIQALAAQLGLIERITFHGFLTQRQLRPVMERAHLNLVSSRHEAGPLVLLEAAVLGIPTVGTAVGHVAEWAPDAAVSVPVGNAAQLASAIAGLLRNEDLRLQIAHEALRRASAAHADETAARFEELYGRLSRR